MITGHAREHFTLRISADDAEPRVGDANMAIAAYHDRLAERVGTVRLRVLHQRLRDEQKLKVS